MTDRGETVPRPRQRDTAGQPARGSSPSAELADSSRVSPVDSQPSIGNIGLAFPERPASMQMRSAVRTVHGDRSFDRNRPADQKVAAR